MHIENKHIVQIMIKNTSTLDFTIPLFWKIKQEYPKTKISILYCVFDKKEILRESKFFTEMCSELNINVYDFSDFSIGIVKSLKNIFKKIFIKSKADKLSFYEIKENIKRYNFQVLPDIFKLILTKMERYILKNSIDYKHILETLSPNIIFFDNRSVSNFVGREYIYEYMYNKKVPTYLIPHAPHMRDAVSEFCPFDERGEELPEFSYFMIPFKYGTPWIGKEDKKQQFFVSGYPGFDSDWLEYCKSFNQKKTDTVNVLFVIRRFLAEGVKREKDTDPFIIDYDEFIEPLNLIKQSIEKSGENIKLVIKPHPANNYNELERIMKKTNIQNWEITHEPMYALLSQVDIVCSLSSTILLVPALAKIPTIIFDTQLQRQIHRSWDKLAELYSGMNFYLDDNSKFQDTFLGIVDNLDQDYNENNIRKFFDDNSCKINITKIEGKK